MKLLRSYMLVLLCFAMVACHKKMVEPEDAPKAVLKAAIDALNAGDIDAYMQCVDFGTEMDSVQEACVRMVLCQKQQGMVAEHGQMQLLDIVDAKLIGDTVCMVYYQCSYEDSTSSVSSQKMVKQGEEWKIRLRN